MLPLGSPSGQRCCLCKPCGTRLQLLPSAARAASAMRCSATCGRCGKASRPPVAAAGWAGSAHCGWRARGCRAPVRHRSGPPVMPSPRAGRQAALVAPAAAARPCASACRHQRRRAGRHRRQVQGVAHLRRWRALRRPGERLPAALLRGQPTPALPWSAGQPERRHRHACPHRRTLTGAAARGGAPPQLWQPAVRPQVQLPGSQPRQQRLCRPRLRWWRSGSGAGSRRSPAAFAREGTAAAGASPQTGARLVQRGCAGSG